MLISAAVCVVLVLSEPSLQQLGFYHNSNYKKILKSDWLSIIVLISALIGKYNWAVCVMPKQLDIVCMHLKGFLIFNSSKKTVGICCVLILEKLKISQILFWLL